MKFQLKKTSTRFTVENCGTVSAILKHKDSENLGVLNFASAKNAGGGFLNGSMAQEESLAFSSGLYSTQLKCPTYYNENKRCKSMCYTEHAIYSPDVVFFRDDNAELIAKPVTASVLTMPAVNMGQVVAKKESLKDAARTMYQRMHKVLLAFAKQGNTTIILGAYGCGVFKNDNNDVVSNWRKLFDTDFKDIFETVIFAILDPKENIVPLYKDKFK